MALCVLSFVGDQVWFEPGSCSYFATWFAVRNEKRESNKKTCTDRHSRDPKLLLALYFDNSLIKCESFFVLFLLLIHLV